ncbi:MAG: DUF2797 domain-containing protein [Bdellovibrionota bacterium]
MKKTNEEKQYVISKMLSILNPSPELMVFTKADDWLQKNSLQEKNAASFQVQYKLGGSNIVLEKNSFLSFNHSGAYRCMLCQKACKKIYSGSCYVCLTTKAAADMCILNPHTCHFAKGTCREPQWGLNFCFQPHYVYIAYTDKFKVGITRKNQILTRWVDQGATMAAPVGIVSSRRQAGVIEKALMEILADKSHWQKMLKAGNASPSQDEFENQLLAAQTWLKDALVKKPNLQVYPPAEANSSQKENIILFDNPAIVKINYPVPENIEKIKSVSLEKEKIFQGKITGIKGQYIFFGERVLNMRSHEGFVVEIEN